MHGLQNKHQQTEFNSLLESPVSSKYQSEVLSAPAAPVYDSEKVHPMTFRHIFLSVISVVVLLTLWCNCYNVHLIYLLAQVSLIWYNLFWNMTVRCTMCKKVVREIYFTVQRNSSFKIGEVLTLWCVCCNNHPDMGEVVEEYEECAKNLF